MVVHAKQKNGDSFLTSVVCRMTDGKREGKVWGCQKLHSFSYFMTCVLKVYTIYKQIRDYEYYTTN